MARLIECREPQVISRYSLAAALQRRGWIQPVRRLPLCHRWTYEPTPKGRQYFKNQDSLRGPRPQISDEERAKRTEYHQAYQRSRRAGRLRTEAQAHALKGLIENGPGKLHRLTWSALLGRGLIRDVGQGLSEPTPEGRTYFEDCKARGVSPVTT
jgi:hypothetical protein